MNTLVFFAILAVVVSTGYSVNVADVPCGRTQVRGSRIKGGFEASRGEFPWVVSIRGNEIHYCGGAIIHRRFILTAAHCTFRRPAQYLTIAAGGHSISSTDGMGPEQIVQVQRVFNHENFTKKYMNDIAILELQKPLVWSKLVHPVCLPGFDIDGGDNALDSRPVTVAGWGLTDESVKGGTYSDTLQKVSVKVIPRSICQQWYITAGGYPISDPRAIILYDNHLCAGLEAGEKDSCQGDSGGPLMAIDGTGREVAVGVVSTGIGCGRSKTPGIYSRVSRHMSWITTVLRESGVAI